MIHRVALLIGGIAAAGILAFSLLRGDRPALSAAESPDVATTSVPDQTAHAAREIVDTVYIAAPRKPKVVRVTRRAPAAHRPASRATQPTTRRHAREDEDERGEHEDREHEDREHEGDD
jgi:hypothetical protein